MGKKSESDCPTIEACPITSTLAARHMSDKENKYPACVSLDKMANGSHVEYCLNPSRLRDMQRFYLGIKRNAQKTYFIRKFEDLGRKPLHFNRAFGHPRTMSSSDCSSLASTLV
jgi:hypothetical protein